MSELVDVLDELVADAWSRPAGATFSRAAARSPDPAAGA